MFDYLLHKEQFANLSLEGSITKYFETCDDILLASQARFEYTLFHKTRGLEENILYFLSDFFVQVGNVRITLHACSDRGKLCQIKQIAQNSAFYFDTYHWAANFHQSSIFLDLLTIPLLFWYITCNLCFFFAGDLVVTITQAAKDKEGNLLGVVGIDVPLEDLAEDFLYFNTQKQSYYIFLTTISGNTQNKL